MVDTADPASPPHVRSLEVLGCELGIRAVFVAELDPKTVDAESFRVEDVAGNPVGKVAGIVAYDAAGRSVTFRPVEPFISGQVYTAELTTLLQSTGNTPLPEPLRWQFSCVDRTAPAVVGKSPVGGGASTLTRPAAEFSEVMDEASITRENVWIEGADATPVYDPSTRTVTLVPSRPLYPGRSYRIHIGSRVRDRAGNPLGADVTWTFVTREPVDDWAARVVSPPVLGAAACDSLVALRMAPGFDFDASALAEDMPPVLVEGAQVRGSEYDGGSRLLRLDVSLLPGQSYAVIATSTFRDGNGERPFDDGAVLASILVIDDCATPVLLEVEDAAGQVACDADTALHFSHPMADDSLYEAIALRDLTAGGHDPARSPLVETSLSQSEDGKSVYALPTAPLVHGRRYAIEVAETALTRDGLPLAAGGSWSFIADCR